MFLFLLKMFPQRPLWIGTSSLKEKVLEQANFTLIIGIVFGRGFFWGLTVLIIKNVMAEISHITQNPLDICYTGISSSIHRII